MQDQNADILPGATILLQPNGLGVVSDSEGKFKFEGIPDGQYRLEVQYLGYQDLEQEIGITGGKTPYLQLTMISDEAILAEITVTEEHAKNEETLSTEHLDEVFLSENRQGNFAKTLEKIPGISTINVGVGIGKPVIRGLSANRIIVNHYGVKQESQQWGSDHGLEIDAYDVERVEIIKGPGSLQYGSDGLGGVINVMPGKILPTNTFVGSVTGVYKSNNDHFGGSALLGINKNDFFLTARYTRQSFGDYRVPASEFEYNSFILPIFDNALKNTAGREQNISLTAGVKRDWGITRLHFSQYHLEAGLFSGAVGIPRSYALEPDGNNRDIDFPSQDVRHTRLTLNQLIFLGDDHISIDVGYQYNERKEFSFPEFHSIPSSAIDFNDRLALAFDLRTWSVAAHYEKHLAGGWEYIYGANVQWQDNVRSGFEFLLPDFKTFRGGIFALAEKKISEDWLINGGLRYDYATNDTRFYQQFIWNSNEVVTDSLIAPVTDDTFTNWSGSIGTNRSFQDGKWVLKANLGKSFRVPYPSETVSNGIHHGTFRHEVGTPDLESEHGYQLDLSIGWDLGKFSGELAAYGYFFDNYIYLGPTFPARFSPLPETGLIFQYRQDDAIYAGAELQWDLEILPWMRWTQRVDFVQTYNLNTDLALPFTPPPAIKNDLRFHTDSWANLPSVFFEISHEYHLAASGRWRIDRSERATPEFQLWHLRLGGDISIGKQELEFNIQAQNLFNTQYLAHLSRYRWINVPEQGRNIVVQVKVPFHGKL